MLYIYIELCYSINMSKRDIKKAALTETRPRLREQIHAECSGLAHLRPTHTIGNRHFHTISIATSMCLSVVELLPTLWPDCVTWRRARTGALQVRVAADGSWRDPQTLLPVALPEETP